MNAILCVELPLLRRSFGFAELCPHLQTHARYLNSSAPQGLGSVT
jgi:hypothetical protein